MRPSGTCDDQDAGLTCQYEEFNGCLCYPSAGFYGYCQQVDLSCPNVGGAGGTGGAAGSGGTGDAAGSGGADAAGSGGADAAGTAGFGGFQAKIAAPPPRELCTCDAGAWTCTISYL
jgi:hypothetical protein